jgi:hypothetical protein
MSTKKPAVPLRLRLSLSQCSRVDVNWPLRIMRSVELCVRCGASLSLVNLTASEARTIAGALLHHAEHLEPTE